MTLLHLAGGAIRTLDQGRPIARSLTLARGRVARLDAVAPPGARIVDLAGHCAVPGLIDAHLHLVEGGEALDRLDLSSITSRADFEAAIGRRHAALPPGRWLLAWGWSEERWGGAAPDRSWLRAAGERPVACWRIDLHAALVNDAVLDRCAIGADPPGGRVARDAGGAPTGLMVESAAWHLVKPLIPDPSDAERRAALRAAQAVCLEHGLTAVGTMEYARTVRDVYLPMRRELDLRCRVTLLDREWPFDPAIALAFDSDDRLAVIGCKAFVDGTLGSRTARMLAPYADAPHTRGELLELARDGHLAEWARRVAGAGLSPSIHAIGDEAARMALDAIETLEPGAAPRLEHVQQLDPADIPRFRGRCASMQPLHKADDGSFLERRVGRERLVGSFAFRALADAGAILAFGSDWPVVAPDPMLGMQAAITGRIAGGSVLLPEQNVTPDEALAAYTRGAAACLRLDGAGTLREGALADVTILDRDPLTCDWTAGVPRAVMTIVGGRVAYDRSGVCTTNEDR